MRASRALCREAVTLVGAGTQGRRLAYMWSSQGKDVRLIDQQPRQLSNSLKFIEELRNTRPGHDVASGTVSTHAPEALEEALDGSWLVVECVPEKLDIKRNIIARLDSLAPRSTIIASNSSSYTISEVINSLSLKDDTRVLSSHSYWPPEVPVLEIMGHENTEPAHIATMIQKSRAHGFVPFHCRHSSIGYIYNRIWAAIKRESLLAAAEGVATPAEIDQIFKAVLGANTGPFAQMDVVGLDVVYDIEQHYAECRDGIPSKPREYLQAFIENRELGVKTGKGFYKYE